MNFDMGTGRGKARRGAIAFGLTTIYSMIGRRRENLALLSYAAVCVSLLSVPNLGIAADDESQASQAETSQPRILIENRTYTPLVYRVSAGTKFGKWLRVLPGERHSFYDSALIIEVSLDSGKRAFRLKSPNTYYHDCLAVGESPAFYQDATDLGVGKWRAPRPPGRNAFEVLFSQASVEISDPFAPLERFVEQSESAGHEYRLSLKSLAEDCSSAQRKGGGIPDDLRYLRGFTWFFGYLVDSDAKDVILLGVKDPTRPPIDLDCICTAIKAVHDEQVPTCALDPHENPKYQKCVITGVPWNTKWAQIMIAADYDMKKICQGDLDPSIENFRSFYDHHYWAIRNREEEVKPASNRFWFNFDDKQPRSISNPSGELLVLYHNPVRVSSELQLGGKYGTGATLPSGERFAADVTNNMEALSKRYPSVAELLALYRLYDLFRHVDELAIVTPPAIDYWITDYERRYPGPPAVMPTLRRRETYRYRQNGTNWTQIVDINGGVSMQLAITDAGIIRTVASPPIVNRIIGKELGLGTDGEPCQ